MPDSPPIQPNNPLHGITLEKILNELVTYYGWEWLGEKIPIRCFQFDPSIKSSLKFLRRTPWARAKVENLYIGYLALTSPEPNPAAEQQPAQEPRSMSSHVETSG